ncbi:MAG: cytidylate kinase family protein [Nanoarchaeota archaeon]
MNPHNTIMIFGFSGSGKSTLANSLGKQHGLRVIHPSSILRDLLEGKTADVSNTQHNTGFWESPEGIRLFKERLEEEEPLDVKSDRILVAEAQKGNVVIDSWSLPWLIDHGIKIYLKTDLEERARRVAKRSRITYEESLKLVAMKDEETRRLFKRVYGFDILTDHQVFDLKIDTTGSDPKMVFKKISNYIESRKDHAY